MRGEDVIEPELVRIPAGEFLMETIPLTVSRMADLVAVLPTLPRSYRLACKEPNL